MARPMATKRKPALAKTTAIARIEESFAEIAALIEQSRRRAFQMVNTALIDLYWQVGEAISRKIAAGVWGEGTVAELALYVQRRQPVSVVSPLRISG